jgi:hypothetical protein
MAEGIFTKLKNNKDTVIGYSSLAGFVITVVYTVIAIKNRQWNVDFTTIVITLAVINFLSFLIVIYSIRRFDKLALEYKRSDSIIRKLSRKNNRLESSLSNEIEKEAKIASIFHNFCHEYRKVASEINSDLIEKDFSQFEDRKSSFKRFLDYMVSNIKQAFDLITGDACSICIKLLEQNDKRELMVKTFIRDHISYRERSTTDTSMPEYNYQANTAFKNILDDYCQDSYYLCNDLKSKNDNGDYNNANNNWNKFYNACLVVPIRLIIDGENSTVVGFICVDNKKGGFEERVGLNTLAAFGDLCYHLFVLFNELNNNAEKNS